MRWNECVPLRLFIFLIASQIRGRVQQCTHFQRTRSRFMNYERPRARVITHRFIIHWPKSRPAVARNVKTGFTSFLSFAQHGAARGGSNVNTAILTPPSWVSEVRADNPRRFARTGVRFFFLIPFSVRTSRPHRRFYGVIPLPDKHRRIEFHEKRSPTEVETYCTIFCTPSAQDLSGASVKRVINTRVYGFRVKLIFVCPALCKTPETPAARVTFVCTPPNVSLEWLGFNFDFTPRTIAINIDL
jgi:hypothetical protein